MGCCFYDLCSPSRRIYGKQSSGEQSQSPWFNKHSLITRHQGQTSEGVTEGSNEELAAREEEEVRGGGGGRQEGAAGSSRSPPLSGPASEPPAGRGRGPGHKSP